MSLRESFCLANDLDPQLSEYEFTDFVPIHEWDCGFSEVTSDEVNTILAADIGSTATLMTGGIGDLDISALNDFEFHSYRNYDKEVTKDTLVNDEGNNTGGAKPSANKKGCGKASVGSMTQDGRGTIG